MTPVLDTPRRRVALTPRARAGKLGIGMDRRTALHKATLTTSDVTAGLLPPEAARTFLRKLKDKSPWGGAIRQEIKASSSGSVDKLSVASRIIRAAAENADDGYRAGATFETAAYATKKIRLPWEVTEDVFHENIEGGGFEGTLLDEMTQQFGLDLDDLEINGDSASADPFLGIDDGLFKLLGASVVAHRVNGALINAGALSKDHFFETLKAVPNRFRNALAGQLRWIMSPARKLAWWEYLTERTPGAAADALLSGQGGAANSPLGIPILEVPFFPDSKIVLADPRNFVRIVSWDVRRRRVTGETDATLAAKDKRFYVFFVKKDFIVEEYDAIAYVDGLV